MEKESIMTTRRLGRESLLALIRLLRSDYMSPQRVENSMSGYESHTDARLRGIIEEEYDE